MTNTKMTSVNSKHAPAIFKYLAEQHLIEDSEIFDFGCGRYFETTMNYVFGEGAARYTPYDLYWEIGAIPRIGVFDIIVCANVLNVIDNWKERTDVLIEMKSLCKPGGFVAIQIYEGERNNVPKKTAKGYQMNCKTSWYYQDICRIFKERNWEITIHRNFILIKYLLPWE